MLRRSLLGAATSVLAAPMLNLGRCSLFAGTRGEVSVQAVDIVRSSLVIDMMGLLTVDWDRLRRWHTEPSSFGPSDFEALRTSGVTVFHPAVDLNCTDIVAETQKWLAGWNHLVDAFPSRFRRINTAADLAEIQSSGALGLMLGMQNSEHFLAPSDVADFWRRGQRLSQLTYNSANRIGSGCACRRDEGLTEFGVSIISEMNRVGMIVDVSHTGERTTLDAIEGSLRPVLITHSNCKALVPHPRCKSDAVIRAMSRKGGVMGITCVRTFLKRTPNASLDDALDHIAHAARIGGVEHVGIGSDKDVAENPLRIYRLTEGMLRRRWSPDHIRLVLGGNFRRAIDSVLA